jgi:glycosyltransferase involved in cell wall biosynthesis
MKLSVVIPTHNEEGSIAATVTDVTRVLGDRGICHEVVVVDDASTDTTAQVVARLTELHSSVRYVRSPYRNGFGFAVRAGLDEYTGDAVAIMAPMIPMISSPTSDYSKRATTVPSAHASCAARASSTIRG